MTDLTRYDRYVARLPLGFISGNWEAVKDGNEWAMGIFKRHYSHRAYADGRKPKLFCGPGEKLVLLSWDGLALFVWRKFISMDNQQGVNCAAFRNEGTTKSSDLILEAEKISRRRWPKERLYTYVNPKKIKSVNPGYCFKVAGWHNYGRTKSGLIILEKFPCDNSPT